MTIETMTRYGRNFTRTADGGWLETGATLPEGSTAIICGDAVVFAAAARRMWGGVFRGGVFWDGVFRDGVFRQSPCCAQRSDSYMFVAKFVDGDLRIWAGCRNFSWDEAVAHWNDAHCHGEESQRIIHFLRAQAEAERDRDAKRAS